MEFFYATELAVPVSQMVLLLLATTLSLLLGRVRLALMINYLFTLYWGYVFNREYLLGQGIQEMTYFSAAYFGFGLAIALLASLGFLLHSE